MFFRADGNDSVEKEHLMIHERERKNRVKSVNKRKETRSTVGVEELSQTGAWTVHLEQ